MVQPAFWVSYGWKCDDTHWFVLLRVVGTSTGSIIPRTYLTRAHVFKYYLYMFCEHSGCNRGPGKGLGIKKYGPAR